MAAQPFEHLAQSGSVSGPPSGGDYFLDRTFRGIAWFSAALILVLVAYIILEIGGKALPAMSRYGLGFLTSTEWNVQTEQFGILPHIWGTLYSSFLALLLGGLFGIAIGIFLTQDFLPPRLAAIFRTIIELLAAIPSVVFGLWGIYVLIPLLRPVANWLHEVAGGIPFFGTSLSGPRCV